MHHRITPDVRKAPVALRTFFWTMLLTSVAGSTWWITKSHYERRCGAAEQLMAQLDSSLYRMNDVLAAEIAQWVYRMQNRQKLPGAYEKINYWKPRIEALSQTVAQVQTSFATLRTTIQTANDQQTIREAIDRLPDQLDHFEELLLQTIPENKRANLADTLTRFRNDNQMTYGLLAGLPVTGRLAVLTRMENTLLKAADAIACFIDQQFGCELMMQDWFDQPELLVHQNRRALRPGQVLEIPAGPGFSRSVIKPRIVIDGIEQTPHTHGTGTCKKRIDRRSSVRFVPVTASFTDPAGKAGTIRKFIYYYILQPHQNQPYTN